MKPIKSIKEVRENKVHGISRVGFVACYKGKEIAFAKDFDVLAKKHVVKSKIGQKNLLIKHNVPEGMIAVY